MLVDQINNIAKEICITDIAFSSPVNNRVGDAPLLDNGLNLLYAPPGYGKSYTAVSMAKETGLVTIYFDMESNGKAFVAHCKKNSVIYIYLGDSSQPLKRIKDLIVEVKKKYGKIFVIIDSFSDLYPDDELTMPTAVQKALGSLNKFFMRIAEMPVLLLDHATEIDGSYKIEGNKSGKFKKTLTVLRLDKIGGDIKNGTSIVVERSRDQDALKIGYKKVYPRNEYMKVKLLQLMKEGKLQQEFSAKDLENCLSGDDRILWRAMQSDIATSRKEGRKILWTLKEESPL